MGEGGATIDHRVPSPQTSSAKFLLEELDAITLHRGIASRTAMTDNTRANLRILSFEKLFLSIIPTAKITKAFVI
jgi:hypothetical protein